MENDESINLILTDFVKYIPEEKRNHYELMLRRCNFTDKADPMFSIMLFLIFMQDNLVDSVDFLGEKLEKSTHNIENLSKEVKELQNLEIVTEIEESKTKAFPWKIVIVILLALQILISGFIFWKVFNYKTFTNIKYNQENTSEIQKMNTYWDMKIATAKKEKNNMNTQNFINQETIDILLPHTITFICLTLIQIFLVGITIRELIFRDIEFKKSTENILNSIANLKQGEDAPIEKVEKIETPPIKTKPRKMGRRRVKNGNNE